MEMAVLGIISGLAWWLSGFLGLIDLIRKKHDITVGWLVFIAIFASFGFIVPMVFEMMKYPVLKNMISIHQCNCSYCRGLRQAM